MRQRHQDRHAASGAGGAQPVHARPHGHHALCAQGADHLRSRRHAAAGNRGRACRTRPASDRRAAGPRGPAARARVGRKPSAASLRPTCPDRAASPGGRCATTCWALRFVTGWGEVVHSGGRVLKNVTGLDLCKLLAGSHGTLGVITEVTLKVLPAPEATGTLVLPGLDAVAGVAALSAGLGSPFGVSGAAWLPAEAAALVPELAGVRPRGGTAADRGFRALRRLSHRETARHAGVATQPRSWTTTASRAVWRAVGDARPLAAPETDAVWRVSVRPSAGPGVLRAAAEAGASGFLDWGGGLVWLAGPATAASHQAVEAAARMAQGTWTLLRAPEPLRNAVQVGAAGTAAARGHHAAGKGGARSARHPQSWPILRGAVSYGADVHHHPAVPGSVLPDRLAVFPDRSETAHHEPALPDDGLRLRRRHRLPVVQPDVIRAIGTRPGYSVGWGWSGWSAPGS